MALNTTTLKNALKSAFLANIPSPTPTQLSEVDQLATAMANAINIFVRSATITYTSGLVAPPSGGPVTGVFSNIIS